MWCWGDPAFYLVLAFLLVPRYSLLGLAYAQTAQTGACFLATWILLRRTIPELPFVPHRWDRGLFREMCGYGLHFQFITASQAAREPVTKALLAKFGGLAMTGIYDMASRWVFTFRELIVQANLVLVPTISGLREREPEAIPAVYRASYRLVFFLGVPAFAFLLAVSPIVSWVWLGHYEPMFVLFVGLLAAGWLVNILSNPAYVVDLGTGALRWVSIGCACTAILNPALGYFAGKYFGGAAVVAVSAFAVDSGLRRLCWRPITWRITCRSGSWRQRTARELCLRAWRDWLIFLPYFSRTGIHSLVSVRIASGLVAAVLMMIILPMWVHPMRKRLVQLGVFAVAGLGLVRCT